LGDRTLPQLYLCVRPEGNRRIERRACNPPDPGIPCGTRSCYLVSRGLFSPPLLAIHAQAHSTLLGRSGSCRSGQAVVHRVASDHWILGRFGVAKTHLQIERAMRGRYSRSFGLSASIASLPCGEWKSLLRHRSDRPKLNSLALGRPQIPVQLSAPVRRGESLTGAKCWAVQLLEGVGAAQHL
jgi:hypothetical protein